MAKKIFTIFILSLSFSMPIFGVTVHVPWNSNYSPENSDYKIWSRDVRYSDSSKAQNSLLIAFDFINEYLRWAFSVVCTAVVVYGWYRMITANWDKKAMKQWVWALVWSAIGIVIAMLSYMIVNLLANLNF
jgi:hypothetical protein